MGNQKLTIGRIQEQLSHRLNRLVPMHRILYAIRARGIKPAGRAGQYRLFDEAAVDQLAAELA